VKAATAKEQSAMALMTPYAVQAHALLAVVLSDSAFPPRSMLLFYYRYRQAHAAMQSTSQYLCPDLCEQVLHILPDEGVVHDGAPAGNQVGSSMQV
jgi:hypothetical protein